VRNIGGFVGRTWVRETTRMGRKGAKVRNQRLTPERRKEIATKRRRLLPRLERKGQKERQALMQSKQPRPVTICTHCRTVGYSLDSINARCGRTVWRNERCRGGISSALNENDWQECPDCSGTGYKTEMSRCTQCDGGVGSLQDPAVLKLVAVVVALPFSFSCY